jgi:hypothetical protein
MMTRKHLRNTCRAPSHCASWMLHQQRTAQLPLIKAVPLRGERRRRKLSGRVAHTPLHGWHPCSHLDVHICLPNHAQRSAVLQGPRVGSHRRRDCVRMAQTGLGDAIWHPQRDVPSLVGGSHAGRAQNPTKFGRGRTCSTLQSQGLWHLTLPQSFRFAGDQASTVSSHVRLNTTVSVAWRPNQAAGNVMVSDVTGA